MKRELKKQTMGYAQAWSTGQVWAMGYVVTPNKRAERGLSGSTTATQRQRPVTLKSEFADIRQKLIANIDPLPSANDNLLFIRGLCSTLLNVTRERLIPQIKRSVEIATRLWPRYIERHAGYMAVPTSVSFLALFEGSIGWSLYAVAQASRTAF